MDKTLSVIIGVIAALMLVVAVSSLVERNLLSTALFGVITGLLGWWSIKAWRRVPATTGLTGVAASRFDPANKAVQGLVALTLAVLFYFYLFPALFQKKVEADTVAQLKDMYQLVKKAGNRHDTCMYAGAVASAMVQAKDSSGYKQWKDIEAAECKLADLPLPQN